MFFAENPMNLMPAPEGPILGTDWKPTVSPASSADFLLVELTPAEVPSPFAPNICGTLLCDFLFGPIGFGVVLPGTPTGGDSEFCLPIPDDPRLFKSTLCVQALQFDPALGCLVLTNAIDLKIGL